MAVSGYTSDGESMNGNDAGSPSGSNTDTTPAKHLAERHRRSAWLRKEHADAEKALAEATASEAADEARAARVGLESHMHAIDPRETRPGRLPIAVLGALLVATVDGLPAYWAAQALGHGNWSTIAVAVLLVASLAGFAALMTHFGHGDQQGMFRLALGLTLLVTAVQSGLRLRYLLVDQDGVGLSGAALEAALLAIITLALVWVGYVLLHRAEPVAIWRERRFVERLERRAEARREQVAIVTERSSNATEALQHLTRGDIAQHESSARNGRQSQPRDEPKRPLAAMVEDMSPGRDASAEAADGSEHPSDADEQSSDDKP